MKKLRSILTRNIVLLSLVSFFTDVASEIIYPVMPLYLNSIGFGYISIGFIEGFANALSGISKLYFGYISDKLKNKVLFIRIGYILSAVSKPLIGLSNLFPLILFARIADRFGKSIRTSPRDAILANESSIANRGKIFGFHRAMDTLGATLGPILAVLFLVFVGNNFSLLFALTLIPGVAAGVLTFMLKQKKVEESEEKSKSAKAKFNFRSFLKDSSKDYKKILFGLFLLSLINSSDMFMLLRAKEILSQNFDLVRYVSPDIMTILLYIIYNLAFSIFSYPVGVISDRLGFKWTFVSGLIAFAIVYGILGMNGIGLIILIFAFIIWGVFATNNESVAKAWISTYTANNAQATGNGLVSSLSSIGFLISCVATGLLWDKIGSEKTFAIISLLAIPVIIYFSFIKLNKPEAKD